MMVGDLSRRPIQEMKRALSPPRLKKNRFTSSFVINFGKNFCFLDSIIHGILNINIISTFKIVIKKKKEGKK